jgi:hypothetical protein
MPSGDRSFLKDVRELPELEYLLRDVELDTGGDGDPCGQQGGGNQLERNRTCCNIGSYVKKRE